MKEKRRVRRRREVKKKNINTKYQGLQNVEHVLVPE